MPLYLNEQNIELIGINWNETIDEIKKTVICLKENDFDQPIKPYLRFRDCDNRIIAMPAFVGSEIEACGIKWIASFPGNIIRGKKRASSVLILNDVNSGEPISIINTSLLSVIRTASVSGLVMNYFIKSRPIENIQLGIIGWGPIGRYHYKMCSDILGDRISKYYLTDLRGINPDTIDGQNRHRIKIVDNWKEIYANCDILITCTVSDPYITGKPIDGALYLNVSLRDFNFDVYEYFKHSIIVDDWEEVCRENTDVEKMHLKKGLQKSDTNSIVDVIDNCIDHYPRQCPIMFNPMGMAVFDIAIANYYYLQAKMKGIGDDIA